MFKYNPTMETAQSVFAQNLRRIRKIRGWSQQSLAELVALSTTTIALYESDTRWPTKNNLKKLAKALKVDELDFFKEDRPTTSPQSVPLLSRDQLKQLVPHDLALEVISEALKKKSKLRP